MDVPPADHDDQRSGWAVASLFALLGSALAVVLAIGAVVVAVTRSSGDEPRVLVDPGETEETETVEVELGDMYVEPATVELAAGTELTLTVTNAGDMAHDLKLNGETGTGMLDPETPRRSISGLSKTPARRGARCRVTGTPAWSSTSSSRAQPPSPALPVTTLSTAH